MRTLYKLPKMRAPLIPIGCPKATAPPKTLTLVGSSLRSFIFRMDSAVRLVLASLASFSYLANRLRMRSATLLTGMVTSRTAMPQKMEEPKYRYNNDV